MTAHTITRQRFIRIEGRRPTQLATRLFYVAADLVQWVEQMDGDEVSVRLESGDEIIIRAEPVSLCQRLETLLTQHIQPGNDHDL